MIKRIDSRYLMNKFPSLYALHTLVRSRQIERNIAIERRYYKKFIAEQGQTPNSNLVTALRERFATRGLALNNKKISDLHVLYVTRPSNWEPHNIPPQLQSICNLSCYYYSEHGFDDGASDWVTRRDELDHALFVFVRDLHERKPIDLFLGYLGGWQISAETIRAIGDLGIVTSAFHWDDKPSFRGIWAGNRWSGPAAVAAAYDINLTNAPASIIKYNAEGALALFWPEAANPEHFKPLHIPFEYDVSFIGACYGYRPILIQYLRDNGVDVVTFGPGWPNGPLAEEDMVEIYARSRINLGFGGIGFSMKAQCLKGRDFEVPMAGALYLTSNNPELSLVYQINKDICVYNDKMDCMQKVKYLLNNPDLCANIRESGMMKCRKEHSWVNRFKTLFEVVGLIAP
jgi:spore maturation protein CgeB